MVYKTDAEERKESAEAGLTSAGLANTPFTAAAPKRRNPGKWLAGWRGLAIGMGLGATIAIVGVRLTSGSQPSNPAPTQNATVPGQSVSVASAQVSRIERSTSVTGSVAARDLLPILARATGLQIKEVLVEEGQTVQAGQPLAILDDSVLQTQINQAQAKLVSAQAVVRQKEAQLGQKQAALAEAESNLRRYESLTGAGATSRQELESRQTAAVTAREGVGVAVADIASAQADAEGFNAQISTLQTQLEQTIVRAPDAGMIAEKIARIGNVTGQDKLFSIIRNGSIELQAKVPENLLAQMKVGTSATITSDADKRINLKGRVREISPSVDAQTRQATVKIDLPTSSLVRPGMFLKAAVTTDTAQATTVPAAAVLPQSEGKSIVYVLEGDIARTRSVEIGSRQTAADLNQSKIEIKSGLNPGDRVIVQGAGYVKDGDRVTIVGN